MYSNHKMLLSSLTIFSNYFPYYTVLIPVMNLSIIMCVSHSVMISSFQPHGLQPARLLCPWDSPGKSTRVGCHFLLQGIFQTQGLNLGLLHCGQILYHLSHQESPSNIICIYFVLLSCLQIKSLWLCLTVFTHLDKQ